MSKEHLKNQLTDFKFSLFAVIDYAEGKVGKGSYELEQLSMMSDSLRIKLNEITKEVDKSITDNEQGGK